jgi:hypothetical protein
MEKELQQRELEELVMKQKVAEEEAQRQKLGKSMLQQRLASEYEEVMKQKKAMEHDLKYHDRSTGNAMIEQAKRSLNKERELIQEKNDYFRQEAKFAEDQREQKLFESRERELAERNSFNTQLKGTQERDEMRESAYRTVSETSETRAHSGLVLYAGV